MLVKIPSNEFLHKFIRRAETLNTDRWAFAYRKKCRAEYYARYLHEKQIEISIVERFGSNGS